MSQSSPIKNNEVFIGDLLLKELLGGELVLPNTLEAKIYMQVAELVMLVKAYKDGIQDPNTLVASIAEDIRERISVGENTYGVKLQPFNGRSAILDLYEELLDSAFYSRQHLYESVNPAETE